MRSRRRIVLALVAGLLLVTGCGDDNDADSSSAASASPVDRAFARQMIAHHQAGVQMAKVVLSRGSSAFVTRLAKDIVRTQTAEIATLRGADRRLAAAGVTVGSLGVPEHMTGMDGDPASLKTAEQVDRAFLQMMIPHHEGAIDMSNAVLERGEDARLKTLARKIVTVQQREIAEMRTHLGGGAATEPEPDAEHDAEHPG
jgi:uncharacterized protein (DUF305 family)